ncbi:DegT/DnrJ/EryC1/StrS family aminotransferase [Defluviicoccus vanus]|uniref:DegT/DnrJ/EryC1/StrS family aminotransferase n=1 Tax=Defluviicoccus vanus TaxID=111831 RepID=A0A7H1N355_9PROT|nr:DegT/DnrJ/EryC1/StrS family aminotransferase [Defluviicoccus vanus]QNT70141.1 DegT/DnrJ/EryC1/StrS family aminotransferase [Defluviicoccus vanus]
MPPIDFSGVKEQTRRYADEINLRIHRVIEHACFIMGPEVVELEVALASYVGVKHCISVASGTTGLEIALRALGVGPGDEVITVPFTWISTAEVVRLVGARPVFVDIDPHTYTIDVDLLAPAMTEKTRAIIPVSLFGQMPDLERIASIAAERGVPVVEDAAQSFGATRRGRRSAGVTMIGCTSFFPAKPFGCYGDGGALFTSDDDLADKMRAIRTHGGLRRHDHPLLGTNGRLDTMQAAILLAKLPHFEWEVRERERLGARYSASLRPSCVPPVVAPFNTHVYAQYTIRVADREQAAEKLETAGVPTGIYYPKCLHEQPVFSDLGYRIGDFAQSEKASREVLSLPMHPFLTESDQDRIVELVNEFCARECTI